MKQIYPLKVSQSIKFNFNLYTTMETINYYTECLYIVGHIDLNNHTVATSNKDFCRIVLYGSNNNYARVILSINKKVYEVGYSMSSDWYIKEVKNLQLAMLGVIDLKCKEETFTTMGGLYLHIDNLINKAYRVYTR